MFPTSLPDSQGNFCGLSLKDADVHIDVTDILREGSAGSSNRDQARLDRDFNTGRDFEFFCLEDVPHLRISAYSVNRHPKPRISIHRPIGSNSSKIGIKSLSETSSVDWTMDSRLSKGYTPLA